MKTLIPAIILVFLYLLFLACVFLSIPLLPDPVAIHFNINGQPNDWMSRTNYLLFISFFVSGLIFFVVIVSFMCRFLPDGIINLPNRQYWLAPERRSETISYFFRQMLWFTCFLLCFLIGIHLSTVHANKHVPLQLPHWEFFGLLGCFFAGVLFWTLILFRHFKKPTNH